MTSSAHYCLNVKPDMQEPERQQRLLKNALQSYIPAELQELTPSDEFLAIDEYLRSYEQQVNAWPQVAKSCLRVKEAELWKHGKYTSWFDWINSAAPFSARKIFLAVGLFKELTEQDGFTPEELSAMPLGSAVALRQCSTAVRRDPIAREAAKRKPKAFIETVKEAFPDQHLEQRSVLYLSETVKAEFDDALEQYRVNHGDITPGEFIMELIDYWRKDG